LEHLDLWLINPEQVFWYDPENMAWEAVRIYGKTPSMLSSLTTSSETVGYSLKRLAIVDGRLYEQTPRDAGTLVRSFLLRLFSSASIGIVLVLIGTRRWARDRW
jgi:hypothetical protein